MGKEKPLVSIVIPAYNHGHYLEEAIQSVLSQDYQHIELIVINDGSSDNTAEILERYRGSFYVETQPNAGQARTLNKGWTMSRGEILAYLSADDFLLPRAVSTAVDYLHTHPDVVLTYSDFYLVDPSSAVIRGVQTPDYNYKDMVTRLICPPGPGAFFRRSAFLAAGLWDVSLRQMPDFEYWLRLGQYGNFARIPEELA
ncbi:MAG: glycosyltransferase, partial [Acidobacteriaceae bacterium]